jgi:hypothetical protein
MLMFDSWGSVDSAGQALTGGLGKPFSGQFMSLAATVPERTLAVRCFTPHGDVRYCGWEFYADGLSGGLQLSVAFWQEFYADKMVSVQPSQRNWPGIAPEGPWMRELDAVSGGAGLITHTPVVRSVLLQARSGQATNDSVYFPFTVNTYWARLGLYINAASSSAAFSSASTWSTTRLRVYAILGGHSEIGYLEENAMSPYVYNAYGSASGDVD